MSRTPILDAADVRRSLRRIAHEIVERVKSLDQVVLVGIQTRGVTIAGRLAAELGAIGGSVPPVGKLDIGLYRDDLASRPTPTLTRTDIPADIDGTTVVLVDDVLFTGRTIRAALDAITDLGRPAAIQLAVLVDRGHRQLPIRADYVGRNLPTALEERVMVEVDDVDGRDGVWLERHP